jgi:endonuclease-3
MSVPAVIRALQRAYPDARTALHYRNPFELLIATIMSAQTTDVTVNRVTPELFRRYPDACALAAADPDDVEKLIMPTGFFRQKTKAIVGCARKLCDEHGGEVPLDLDELVKLPGVARKTANVVLANLTPGRKHGIFVDTHVRRVSQRLGWTTNTDPVKIEQDLMRVVPKRKWADVPHQLIELGRGPCEAKRPRHLGCPLLRWCPTGQEAVASQRAVVQRPVRRVRTR